MNNEWTYTDSLDDWSYETFPNKEEAIIAARITFEGNFFVGQLKGTDDEGLEFFVDNIQEIWY